jgi:hypothetical protein
MGREVLALLFAEQLIAHFAQLLCGWRPVLEGVEQPSTRTIARCRLQVQVTRTHSIIFSSTVRMLHVARSGCDPGDRLTRLDEEQRLAELHRLGILREDLDSSPRTSASIRS